jgi:hypothetical protein
MRKWLIVPGLVGVATTAAAIANFNFGLFRDHQLDAHSIQLFGIVEPVGASSAASIDAVTADADPTSLVTIAKGLSARRHGERERRRRHRHDGALAQRPEPDIPDCV